MALPQSGSIVAGDLTPEPRRTYGFGTATLLRPLRRINLQADGLSRLQLFASNGSALYSHDALTGPSPNDPNSDPGQDWYYWDSRALKKTEASGLDTIGAVSWEADIRTARRLRSGNVLLFSIAAASANDVALTGLVTARLLWAIP